MNNQIPFWNMPANPIMNNKEIEMLNNRVDRLEKQVKKLERKVTMMENINVYPMPYSRGNNDFNNYDI